MSKFTTHTKYTFLLAGAAALAITTLAGGLGRHGTDILHFAVRKAMVNEGVIASATGSVEARQNQQGNANNQKLDIVIRSLDTNTPYQLLARLDGDTNFTQVAEFNSDAKGRLAISYRKVGSSNSLGAGLGRGKTALPATLDPVSNVRELVLAMNSTQAVLRADLMLPDKFEYLIKRDLSTTSADAVLRIQANPRQARIRLLALDLIPANDYLLALNGGVVETNQADAKGRLVINSALENPVEIFGMHSLALWDSASNVVLSTSLP